MLEVTNLCTAKRYRGWGGGGKDEYTVVCSLDVTSSFFHHSSILSYLFFLCNVACQAFYSPSLHFMDPLPFPRPAERTPDARNGTGPVEAEPSRASEN